MPLSRAMRWDSGRLPFLMLVTHEAATWREQTQRTRSWFPRDEAAALVEEGALAMMIRTLLHKPQRLRESEAPVQDA